MRATFILICFLLSFVWVPSIFAADNTCWLSAGSEEDVWVIVYDADVFNQLPGSHHSRTLLTTEKS